MSEIPKETLIDIYRKMLTSRYFDDTVESLQAQGIAIMHHAAAGQEAASIAACAALRKDDYLLPYHRGYHHYIGKGMDIKRILAELLCKKTGYCEGKAGPHLADIELKVMGRSGIQGAHIQIAAGIGLSIKKRKTDQVCLCIFGEGASNIGFFHEGVNLASIWKAPVIFLVENNKYSVFTPSHWAMRIEDIADRAASYGIPGVVVDGMDPIASYKAVYEAIERARIITGKGLGPTLIEAKVYRFRGHTSTDIYHDKGLKEPHGWVAGYRPKEELEEWKKKDPIPRFGMKLIEMGVLTEKDIQKLEEDVKAAVKEAEKFALESPEPEREDAFKDVYA